MKNEEYQMTMSEFKGRTLQALEDLKTNISDLKDTVNGLQNQLNSQRLVSAVMGGVAGIVAAILDPFKK